MLLPAVAYGCLQGTSYLFMPRLPASYAVWMGALATPEDSRAKYGVDVVHYVDEMAAVRMGGMGRQRCA